MEETPHVLSTLAATIAVAVPLALALAAVPIDWRDGVPLERRIQRGTLAALAFSVLALALFIGSGEAPRGVVVGALPLPAGWPRFTVRLDVVTAAMLPLVTFICAIIARYTATALRGEAVRDTALRSLVLTLASVTLLVVTNNLVAMCMGWLLTSVALHGLLTLYSDRTEAIIAAHKKFITSRAADLSFVIALGAVWFALETFELDEIHRRVEAMAELPLLLDVAMVFFVVGACLKCAQLPFHGWLLQVMEAPTPVSALLHAGVVNIGGFLMIRLAPLLVRADAAATLLMVIGGASALVATLAMMTRTSVKVALAWSTCAQMGLMLVQCALGAFHLALLHLVAHSLYKAHAFLSAGSTVERWRASDVLGRDEVPRHARVIGLALTAVTALVLTAVATPNALGSTSVGLAFSLVTAGALLPLVTRAARSPRRVAARIVGAAGLVVATGVVLHASASLVVVQTVAPSAISQGLRGAFVVGLLALLAVAATTLHGWPDSRIARFIAPRLDVGLAIDEVFTRLTFRVWPARLPATPRLAASTIRRLEARS